MRKIIVFIVLALAVACVPFVSFTEDKATVELAKVMYAMAKGDSDAQIAIGTVIMNRVESPWYAESLTEVMSERHQFPSGERYDSLSLSSAHAVLSGERNLPESAVVWRQATEPLERESVVSIGDYLFYDSGR